MLFVYIKKSISDSKITFWYIYEHLYIAKNIFHDRNRADKGFKTAS